MAYANARTIKQAVDEVIDTVGASHVQEIGVEADEWGPFCEQAGLNPKTQPGSYRGVSVRPIPVGGGLAVQMSLPY